MSQSAPPLPSFADVAIPGVPMDVLTYRLAPELAERALRGQRLVVPLGRRLVTGIIARVHSTPPGVNARFVREISDSRPSISDGVFRLCEWVARYYVCSLGDALKAALPQGMTPGSELYASIASQDEERISAAVGRSALKAQIIDALRTGEVLSMSDLRDRAGVDSISVQLNDLERDGVVLLERMLERPKARPKLIKAVRLVPEWTAPERLRELMDILEKRAPRQVDLLATLWSALKRGTTSIPMRELTTQARAGTAQIRALEDKGVVEIFDQEDIRRPVMKYEEHARAIVLNADQTAALSLITDAVDAGGYHAFLLHGVTASGKTQVYIEAIRHTLAQGRNALVLVPEIALTPQLVFRFQQAFGRDVIVMHSRMSVGERFDAWRQTLEGACRVVIGVRAAVFAPLENIGLIVVDEEHEPGYKQSDLLPRYNARDTAVMRAHLAEATVVLGTATPSVESWWNVQSGKYALLSMPRRVDDATLPEIVTVDMTAARRMGRITGSLSHDLIERLADGVRKGEGAIVFQNRRGYAPHLECTDCGHVEECDNCSISLTYHKDGDLLRCHYCGSARRIPALCPRCGGGDMELRGAGTQRIEEELHEALPAARIVRMDLDTTRRKGAHDLLLTAFGTGEADIMVGTQMVARGLDFDRVTLVGIVSGEQSLLFPDFRAGERTFQLLTQVAGRAGRGGLPGLVLLQSTRPSHPVFRLVIEHDVMGFLTEELRMRRELRYPPFSRLALLTFSGPDEAQVTAAAEAHARGLQRRARFYTALPPQPALLRKVNNRHRHQILIRIDKAGDPDGGRFHEVITAVRAECAQRGAPRSVQLDVDVDPMQLS